MKRISNKSQASLAQTLTTDELSKVRGGADYATTDDSSTDFQPRKRKVNVEAGV